MVAKINAGMGSLLQHSDILQQLANQGMIPAGAAPERFGILLRTELARRSRVVAAAKIRLD